MKEYNKEECDKEWDNFLELLEHDNLANVKYVFTYALVKNGSMVKLIENEPEIYVRLMLYVIAQKERNEGNTKMTSVDRKGNDLVHTFRVQLSKEEMIEKYRGTIYLPF